ncbi:MAG: substrate-binding periplasmic protein [Campylobacterota bacterium]
MKYIIISLLIASVAFAQNFVVSTGEWKPWVSQSLKDYGVAPAITHKAFEQVGIDVDFSFYPWKRAYYVAKVAKADASGFWLKTHKREKDFYYSDSVFSIKNILIFKKDKDIKIKSIEDLSNYKIGITRGYSYSQKIDDMILEGKIQVHVVNSDLAGLRQVLKKDEFDAFLCAKSVAKTLIDENFSLSEKKQISFSKKAIFQKDAYLMVSKQHPNAQEVISKFNKGLALIKSNGVVSKMIEESSQGKYK